MSNIIENLKWRYATKKFDPSKKISPQDLETLKEAIQLSASSYGLQPYQVLIIEDQEIREKLKPAAWNQTQITDASHLVVFANKVNLSPKDTEAYMNNISATRNIPVDSLNGFSEMINGVVNSLPEDAKAVWTSKQTYIALGNLLAAAAELKIDSCPMEGFEADKFNEILGLNEKGLNAAVIAPVGYRSEEDNTQEYIKVRKPKTELFTTI
ncbi:Nitroreductase [Zhouia amylolytica]|uniref:Nitroreductase n=1 Tax=Zhouia amylolytica TaxID=376730 RepID=A0A1I6TR26_9FLAO|nr:NAD(P)H-dependent oxidoreductase [Zhouia amylolytica]MCQ0110239.1 NAD(P)H-dependent oxidoreductase [Zhouia amylolytica]SFS91652.1 Nitroreductase [Zhouia amylolytica]